jgi:hypothetical protein
MRSAAGGTHGPDDPAPSIIGKDPVTRLRRQMREAQRPGRPAGPVLTPASGARLANVRFRVLQGRCPRPEDAIGNVTGVRTEAPWEED